MEDRSYGRSRYNDEEHGFHRFGRWLSKRPAESWAFFVAGLLIAGILF